MRPVGADSFRLYLFPPLVQLAMRPQMSTQALLDELAARERRVLEQLHELSGINQSPISPQQAYASMQATPQSALSSPARTDRSSTSSSSWRTKKKHGVCDREGEEAHNMVPAERPHDIVGNLARDLARLRLLLLRSPLNSGARPKPQNHDACSNACTPTWQHYDTLQSGVEEETERAMAAAREKRLRVSPAAPFSGSPVTPDTKRDRRETLAYAPPPPLSFLSPHQERISPDRGATQNEEAVRAVSLDGRAPSPRRSAVLDMTDDGEGDTHDSRGYTMPRSHASVSASRFGRAREVDDVRSFSEACWRGGQPLNDSVHASSGATWSRSPVCWVASPQEPCNPCGDARQEEEGRKAVLCISALDAWDTHRSPQRHGEGGDKTTASPAAFRPSLTKLSTPPPTLTSLNEASQQGMAQPGVSFSTSPSPRLPGTSSSPPKAEATIGLRPTSANTPAQVASEMTVPSLAHVTVPHIAETPQPMTKGHNLTGEAAVSMSPRGVTRTTSWNGLRAFFARQSRVGVLLTPDVAMVEQSEQAHG